MFDIAASVLSHVESHVAPSESTVSWKGVHELVLNKITGIAIPIAMSPGLVTKNLHEEKTLIWFSSRDL
jgi:hypothetical protein